MSLLLTKRSQELRDKFPEERPPCEGSCSYLIVDEGLWRCEKCLRYLSNKPKVAVQGGLFD